MFGLPKKDSSTPTEPIEACEATETPEAPDHRIMVGTLDSSDCCVDGEHINKIDRRLRTEHEGGETMVNVTTRIVYFIPP